MQRTVMKTALLLTLAAGATLGGCVQGHLDPEYGVAVRQDIAAQIADPDARYPQAIKTDATRVAVAQDRYQKDKVTPPQGASSTVGLSQGSSSTPASQ